MLERDCVSNGESIPRCRAQVERAAVLLELVLSSVFPTEVPRTRHQFLVHPIFCRCHILFNLFSINLLYLC